jgi:hypothetical protein
MEISLRLAMNTFTPVTFWLGMPVLELIDWIEEAVKVAQKGDGLMYGTHV